MHKNPFKSLGNGIKKTTFQNFPREHAPGPLALEVVESSAWVWQIHIRPSSKFLSPYAYGPDYF